MKTKCLFSLFIHLFSAFSTPEPQDSMCRSVTQLSDDDERMSVGSRGSVRVSITAQHEQRRRGEPSFHHLLSTLHYSPCPPCLPHWCDCCVVCFVQSDLEAVGVYSGGVREVLLTDF